MPFRSTSPLVKVELDSMSTIDTRNVENLFGLWSVFHKCANTMEDGKRLENLSWRLWNRETFCCASEQAGGQSGVPASWRRKRSSFTSRASSEAIPSLSSSMSSDVSSTYSDSSDSEGQEQPTSSTNAIVPASSSLIPARPELRRLASDHRDSHNKGNEKHITPVDLKQIVVSIRETTGLEKLPPLPPSLVVHESKGKDSAVTSTLPMSCQARDSTPRPLSNPRQHTAQGSSMSPVGTASTGYRAEISPPAETSGSAASNVSTHSIVHGFQLGRISSSIRSNSNLAPTPTPVLKRPHSPSMKAVFSKNAMAKRKQPTFMLGGSSGEDPESSLDTHYADSNVSSSIKANSAKTASFKEEPTMINSYDESEEVFESDSEDDIDDDWEDEDEVSEPPSVNDHDLFKRVDSRPDLTSRKSLLTQAIHEPDRAAALRNLASRSTTAIRRSRTSTPNGPSLACSPKEGAAFELPDGSGLRSKPIIMTTSNSTQPLPAMSPRTTRRNMLSTEMTESLRRHLLWERQQKNNTANAHLKRRHTSNDIKNLTQYPHSTENKNSNPSLNASNVNNNTTKPAGRLPTIQDHMAINSWSNNHFDSGLLEYHEKGW